MRYAALLCLACGGPTPIAPVPPTPTHDATALTDAGHDATHDAETVDPCDPVPRDDWPALAEGVVTVRYTLDVPVPDRHVALLTYDAGSRDGGPWQLMISVGHEGMPELSTSVLYTVDTGGDEPAFCIAVESRLGAHVVAIEMRESWHAVTVDGEDVAVRYIFGGPGDAPFFAAVPGGVIEVDSDVDLEVCR